jgi:peptide deformylase
MVREILQLGNPVLYQASEVVLPQERGTLQPVVTDLHDTMMDFKGRYGAGRAIAAPQIGVFKRLIYMYIDQPMVFFNPELVDKSDEMMTVWDDCMSFAELFVKVRRHRQCTIRYLDETWQPCEIALEGDLSELLQHEYDHLDGILAVSRAVDEQSFCLRSQIRFI